MERKADAATVRPRGAFGMRDKNGRFRPGQKRLGFVGSYRREEPLAANHQGFHRLPSLQRLAPHKAELEPASATAWPLIKAPINADIG
jgi:hypothetical protein